MLKPGLLQSRRAFFKNLTEATLKLTRYPPDPANTQTHGFIINAGGSVLQEGGGGHNGVQPLKSVLDR